MTTFPDFRVDEAFLYKVQKVPAIKSDKVKNIKMKDFVSNDTHSFSGNENVSHKFREEIFNSYIQQRTHLQNISRKPTNHNRQTNRKMSTS